jgi:NAD(P)-dependent dehydrogenase (short-subunit alcohol dehydrogenase family)
MELLSTEAFRRQLEVNVLGTHAVTQAMLPLLRAGSGRIVLMGSISGWVSPPHYGAYAASKHALEALADAFRVELRPWGIPVSIVEPDSVKTTIWNKLDDSVSRLNRQVATERGQLYEREMQRIRQQGLKMGRTGISTARVVAVVRRALSSRHPRARYPVGLRTRVAMWAAANLPASLVDGFVRRAALG